MNATTINTIKNTHATVHGVPFMHMVEHYLQTFDWQVAIHGVTPKVATCGFVYELKNPFGDADVSFVIADMRHIVCSAPHYHINHETEIYVVLQGTGLVVVGEQERHVAKGDVIITPPLVTHFTLPDNDLVLAVINTPPFNEANVVEVHESCQVAAFDKDQFDRLVTEAMQRKEESTR